MIIQGERTLNSYPNDKKMKLVVTKSLKNIYFNRRNLYYEHKP